MNQIAKNFFKELEGTILQAKSSVDQEKLDNILQQRKEWIDTYNELDREEVLRWILKTDTELINLLRQKAVSLKEKILEEDDLDRNRGSFKLYE